MDRELPREEKAATRKPVKRLCTNYDWDVGCLPLVSPCYNAGKVLDRDAMPLLPGGPAPETRPCPVYGRAFLPDGRTRYCSSGCTKAALQQQKEKLHETNAELMCGKLGPENDYISRLSRAAFEVGNMFSLVAQI